MTAAHAHDPASSYPALHRPAPGLLDKVIATSSPHAGSLEPLGQIGHVLYRRLETDPETVEREVTLLVLTVVEMFRETMEREALNRVDVLPDEQLERMGRALQLMDSRLGELCEQLGVTRQDVSLGLAQLARLA